MNLHRFYVDQGISSYATVRPEFKALLEDIENKVCNCVIVKDLSRFGRDYIETGKYVFNTLLF